VKPCESTRGKYRVTYNPVAPESEQVTISVRTISGTYVQQSIPINSLEDLKDLFITTASVLNLIYDNDNFK
jgi:hypothetical protein